MGGFNKLAVHLFIMYWAVLSHITPPVCIAAFAAASLAESDPMKTGFQAAKLGIGFYVLSFIFIFNPALILQGEISETIWIFVMTALALFLIAAAFERYFYGVGELNIFGRIAFFILGVLLVIPETNTDLFGLGILILFFVLFKIAITKKIILKAISLSSK